MSDDSIHLIVTIAIIAVMFAWVPFVNVICPPGWRSTRPSEKKEQEAQPEKSLPQARPPKPAQRAAPTQATPLSTRSRRHAEQSRDLLQAMGSRGDREVVRPQQAAMRVPARVVENSLSRREINNTCAE